MSELVGCTRETARRRAHKSTLVLLATLGTSACAVGQNALPDRGATDASRTDGPAMDARADATSPADAGRDATTVDARADALTTDARADVVGPPDARADVAEIDTFTPPPDVEEPPPPDVFTPPPDVFVPPPDVFTPPPDVVAPPPDVPVMMGTGAPGDTCARDTDCSTGGASCCLFFGGLPIGVCACRDPIFRTCQPLTCP